MILVDTCVLIDVIEDDARWSDWSTQQLAWWTARGEVLINPLVFAEWSTSFPTLADVEAAVERLTLRWRELPREALFMAAKAHALYRRRGGAKAMVLPDFLIGAHAAVQGLPLLTRDRRRFETYFQDLEIVSP